MDEIQDNKGIVGHPIKYEYKGRVRSVEYIACKKVGDVIKSFPVNWQKLADSEIVKKVSLIYDSLGWNLLGISESGKQTLLSEW